MQVFRLVILLATLPLLFLIPYFFLNSENKDEGSQAENLTTPFQNHAPHISDVLNKAEKKEKKILQSEHRFEKKVFSKNHESTHIQNSINYWLFAPPKPWPKTLKFPLVIHLNDHDDIAYSAEYISQSQMTFNFPAFSIVPETERLYDGLNIEERLTTITQPMNFHINEEKTRKSAVNFESFRDKTKKILPPLIALIDDVKKSHPIDKSRIYLIGCGFGAATLFHLIEKRPEDFASMVAISSTWETENFNKFKSTPILNLNGKNNAMFLNISGKTFAKNVKKVGGKAIYKGFESMPHTCSYKQFYASNVWKWMFAQKRQ